MKDLKFVFLTSTMIGMIALMIAAIYKSSLNPEESGKDRSFNDNKEEK